MVEVQSSLDLMPGVVSLPHGYGHANTGQTHAAQVAGVSINDLTQYTMAADRMATDLVHLTDPWQPAVLHLVAITAAAGKNANKPVGVCGEAAADPLLACVLVGMGITSLSMASASVRAVGAQISQVTMQQCRYAAEAAAGAHTPAQAREAARVALSS